MDGDNENQMLPPRLRSRKRGVETGHINKETPPSIQTISKDAPPDLTAHAAAIKASQVYVLPHRPSPASGTFTEPPTPVDNRDVKVASQGDRIQALQEYISHLELTCDSQQRELELASNKVKAAETFLNAAGKKLAANDEKMAAAQKDIAVKDKKIAVQSEQIANQDEEIADLELKIEKDRLFYVSEIENNEEWARDAEDRVEEKDREIREHKLIFKQMQYLAGRIGYSMDLDFLDEYFPSGKEQNSNKDAMGLD